MKKSLILVITIILVLSIISFGISCKEVAPAEEVVEEEVAPAEEVVEEEVAPAEEEEKEPVTLHVIGWAPGGPEYWEATNNAFMEKYPWITVNYESIPRANYFEKQGAYIASRSGPDVMSNVCGFELWDRADSYMPINDLLARDNIDENDFYDGFAQNSMLFDPEKGILGLSPTFQSNVMYYNKDILTEAGLDPENPPRTWDEFIAAADKIKAIGKVPLAAGGIPSGATNTYWFFSEIAKQFFQSEEDIEKFMRGEMSWSDPTLRNSLEFIDWIFDQDLLQEGAASITMLPDAGDVFIRGDAAFIYGLASNVFCWWQFGEAMGHDKIGVMKWPIIDEDAPFADNFSSLSGGSTHGITPWSEQVEEAWLYVQWIGGVENANIYLKMAGNIPKNKNFDKSLIDFSPSYEKILTFMEDDLCPFMGIFCSSREIEAFGIGFQEMMLNDITVDEWVDSLNTALEQSEMKDPDNPIWQ